MVSSEGVVVGTKVGLPVGDDEGVVVRTKVGLLVGDSESVVVGTKVGILIGDNEGVVVRTKVGVIVGEKEQGIAFGDPMKISLGEVITVPIQYTQTKEGMLAKA